MSRRRFISAARVGQDAGGRTIYEVEYEWVPTAAGEKVKHVLTNAMAVEEGAYLTRVYLQNSPDLIAPGPHGWVVSAIDDFEAVRLR